MGCEGESTWESFTGNIYFLIKGEEGHREKATLLAKKKKRCQELLQPFCQHEGKPQEA